MELHLKTRAGWRATTTRLVMLLGTHHDDGPGAGLLTKPGSIGGPRVRMQRPSDHQPEVQREPPSVESPDLV